MKTEIKGNFDWQFQKIMPAFVQGEDAKSTYDYLNGLITGDMGFDEKNRLFWGSTPFVSAHIDTKLMPLGIRVANRFDIHRPEVIKMIKGKHYTDTPTLILRSTDDSYLKNLPLIKRVAELVEQKNGRLELPVMIIGFDAVPWPEDDNGYKININPRSDFTAINDERLSGDYHGKKFSEVDGIALPNFDRNGTRTWYARNEGLSRLFLSGGLNAYSDDECLANSCSDGRVVLVSGEATAPDLKRQYIQKLRLETEKRKSELNK